MPEAVSARVTIYRKLAKGETGLTQLASVRVNLGTALQWILEEMPDEAWEISREKSEDRAWDIVTLRLDWSKVPDSIRAPVLPKPRGR
jgi:hypothetical protein